MDRGVMVKAVDVFEQLDFGDVFWIVLEGAGYVGLYVSISEVLEASASAQTSSAAFSFMRT